jgi:serine/threonine protein kinase/TPR repeat protein
MASFCYVCGTATPAGLNRETGEAITMTGRSGIGPADLIRKLQRALGPGYELQDRIGAGGFAEVFRARDLRLKRDLAVKVLRPDLGLSPDLLQRFRREAETIATLRNVHIVPVFDIGEAEGLAFIIMPLISGESLRGVLDREGAMQPAEVRRVLREAALGLAAAHDAGVIHRDIKPENIMLEGRDKRVLLMDFGISKAVGALGDGDPSQALTTTGIIIGTPQYMSPEQACGDKSIDARSDQYSLAVVGYRMLAGGLPFEGESTRAVLYQQLVAEPPPIATKVPGIPGGLANAIQRAMAKEPNERFASMIEFAAMLDTDAPASRPKPVPSRSKLRRNQVIAAAAIVVLAAGGWLISARGKSTPPPPPAPVATIPPAIPPATPPAGSPTAVAPGPVTPAIGALANGAVAPGNKGRNTKAPVTTTTATPPKGAATTAIAPPPAGSAATCARLAAAANWTGALAVCTKEAEAGNAVSQRTLGSIYDKGSGVTESPTDAAKWYRRAASNDPEAQFLLSHLLEIGRGVPRNDAESIVLLQQAASGGVLRAQLTLADRLEHGAGIKKDESQAVIWYRRAAEHGDIASELKLAEFLARGRGIDKNEAEALDWWRKAGDQGSGEAAWQASQMYLKGHGTAKDTVAGVEWLKKAATLNQPDAVKEMKKRTG